MMDQDGNIVVYIGQPWHNPAGILQSEGCGVLLIETPGGVIASVDSEGFSVSHMPYKQYVKWKKSSSGIPKKKEEEISEELTDRFELIDFDDE